MKTTEQKFLLRWVKVSVSFFVRFPPPHDRAEWGMPEVVYHIFFATHNKYRSSFQEPLIVGALNGAIPIDLLDNATEERTVVRAVALCMELVAHGLNWVLSPNGKRELPPQNYFDVALSTLISAALNGIQDILAHSPMAKMLMSASAYLPSSPVWLESGTVENIKDTQRNCICFEGPFWRDIVAELAGANKSAKGE